MKKVYLCFLTLIFILVFQIHSSAEMRSSITQYGITWNFDGQYECGQFVTGDWWVVGPVTIMNTNPAQTAGRNGSMLNPIGRDQGYDDRGMVYDANVRVSFPFTIGGVNSLVTTLSETRARDCETGAGNAGWTSRFGRCDNRSAIRTMAVLTIVNSPIPAGTFRPSYIGSGYKEFFNISQLDYNVLPHLPVPATTPNVSGLIPLLERPWLDHYNGWTTQINYAFDNSAGYGTTMCDDIGNISCCLMLDIPELEQLAMLMVQRGIELYGAIQNGATWPADGGHGSGRKLPILLAGKLLNNSNMLSIGSTYPTKTFGEDCQTYYSAGQPWWGIRHCTNPELDGDALTTYRICCTGVVWSGQSLVAQMLGLCDEWNHNAFFDYVDRWISEGGGYGKDHPSFIQEMWSTYRNNLPAEIPHNGGGGIVDDESPTIPTGLNASNITGGSLSLSWTASTDNVNVIAYDIYQDESFVKTISGAYISTSVDNLICNTTYSFKVLARDASGNSSDFSDVINVTTTNDCAPVNVALNKIVIASAIDGENTGSNLVDGNTSDNARWSASDFPQWAEIDLGSDQDIIGFNVFTYQSRAYQYTIEAKADGGAYSVVVDRSSNTSNSQPISDNVNVTARYIKLTVTGASGYTGTWVSINELEVLIDGNSTIPVDVPVEGISLSPVTLDLTAGQSAQLTETISPSNATNKNVTWTSLDETIATVDNTGLVTAVDVGTTTITVMSNEDNTISANCAVTVSTVPPPTGGFYCDPVNGNMSNTGTENSPWSTLAEVISAGKTFQAGDIIYLKNGDHGWPDITQSNSGVVTIKNYPGHAPVINRLDFNNASHWKIEGVKIYTSSAPPAPPVLEHPVYGIYDNYLVRLNGSSNITIESCNIYSIENSSTWTADDWNYKAWCGVYFYNNSNNNTIKNSTIKNVNFAIDMSNSSANNVQNNIIQNFCGDGIRVSTDCIIENNQILDSYSTNGNHADAMQAFASARAVVRNNTIISATSERSFIAYGMQGLGFFDGFFTDYTIENNLIVCHTWHGISLYGATNCKIVNNTVVENPIGTNPYGPPWIAVYNHKDGSASTGNIVSNNLTSDIGSMQGATASYNIETTDYTSHFVDYATLDFHLSANSTAIDAGTANNAPATDIEGNSRPLGSGIDIGAYEGDGVVIPDHNIALNKPVIVSAYQDDEFGYQPGTMLVDGNVSDDARWAASGFPQWAEIDLGQNYDLTEIKLYPFQNRPYQYIVEAKADGGSYSTIADRSANTESADILTDTVSGVARYIKITVSGIYGNTSTWVSLAELKVYGDEVVPVSVTDVSVDPETLTLEIDETSDLTVTVFPADATDKSVDWSSNTPSVATVDENGLVTAIAEGTAIIKVETNDGNFTATCAVTVIDNPVITNLALNRPITVSAYQDDTFGYKPGENLVDGDVSDDARWSASGLSQWAEIDLGQNYDLTQINLYPYQDRAYQYIIEAKADGGSYTTIVDRSSNTEGADVLSDNVSGIARYVKITTNGLSGSTSTWVSLSELEVMGSEPAVVHVTDVNISASSISLNIGECADINEIATPADADDKTVVWTSDNEAIATVNTDGLICGLSDGTATITVTTNDGGHTATCAVTVIDPTVHVTGVSLSATTLNLMEGETSDLDETVSPANATDPTVVWTSDDVTIATVDQNGNVSAIAEGTTDISVTTNDNGYSATCVVTVTAIPNRIETLSASTDDNEIRSNGGAAWVGSSTARVGGAGSGYDGCLVIPFQLPALNTGEAVLSANFSATLKRVANSPDGNVDVYGLPSRSSGSVLSNDYYQGAFNGDVNATAIQDDFATPGMADELLITTNSGGGTNLADYINAQYTAGAQAGDYIFIRLNPDVADVTNYYFWEFYTANSPNAPVLEIEIGDNPSKNGQSKTVWPVTYNIYSSIKLWPNPISEGGILSVKMNNFRNNDCLSFKIYDITGKTVYVKNSISLSDNISITLNTSEILKKGIYIISVSNGITVQKEKLIIR